MGTLKVNGNIEASSMLKLNGDWENDFGILLQEGGGDAYGGFIKYGSSDYLTIGTRENGTDVVALKITRGSANITALGSITATSFIGNASTASKLKTARTISLTGSVTGSGTFDGSGNLSIATTTNHTHSYLPLSGGTVTGTLTLSRSTDASGTVDKKPALITGGASTAQHLEFDGNEIMSKSDGTTPATLYLNGDGGQVSIGGGGLKVNGTITANYVNNVINTKEVSGAAPGITEFGGGWFDVAKVGLSYETAPSCILLGVGSDYYYTSSSAHIIAITAAHYRSTITKVNSLVRPDGVTSNGIMAIGVTWTSGTEYVISVKVYGQNSYYARACEMLNSGTVSSINFTKRSSTPSVVLNL